MKSKDFSTTLEMTRVLAKMTKTVYVISTEVSVANRAEKSMKRMKRFLGYARNDKSVTRNDRSGKQRFLGCARNDKSSTRNDKSVS